MEPSSTTSERHRRPARNATRPWRRNKVEPAAPSSSHPSATRLPELLPALRRAASPAGWIFLALGGNQGDTRAVFRRALAALEERLGPIAVAPLYLSAPLSPIAQPDFLNTVAAARLSDLPEPTTAEALLAFAHDLEQRAGRRHGPRLGPRSLDLDLLFFGRARLRGPELTLPHPRLAERSFVLEPLADLAPVLRLPPDGRTAASLAAELAGEQEIRRVPWQLEPAARSSGSERRRAGPSR